MQVVSTGTLYILAQCPGLSGNVPRALGRPTLALIGSAYKNTGSSGVQYVWICPGQSEKRQYCTMVVALSWKPRSVSGRVAITSSWLFVNFTGKITWRSQIKHFWTKFSWTVGRKLRWYLYRAASEVNTCQPYKYECKTAYLPYLFDHGINRWALLHRHQERQQNKLHCGGGGGGGSCGELLAEVASTLRLPALFAWHRSSTEEAMSQMLMLGQSGVQGYTTLPQPCPGYWPGDYCLCLARTQSILAHRSGSFQSHW